MAYTYDDGIIDIYTIENIAKKGDMPKDGLKFKSSFYFGYETVGITRFYNAKSVDEMIDEVIHIYEDRTIRPKNIAVIDGIQYRINQAQHTTDDDGIRITVLSLEKKGRHNGEIINH